MLAERTRVRFVVGMVIATGIVGGGIAFMTPATLEHRQVSSEDPVEQVHSRRSVPSPRLVIAKLDGPLPRTNDVVESDWAKAYRLAHDGTIETWTTMDHVHLPALDHRLFERVRPLCPEVRDDASRGARWIAIDLRSVVDGDAEAARERVARTPGIEVALLERDTLSLCEGMTQAQIALQERPRCRLGAMGPIDRLFVVMREPVERTGVDVESDWEKSHHMAWNGPIRTWTTMVGVWLPGFEDRRIRWVAPTRCSAGPRCLIVRVHDPKELDAVLEWVRAKADVELASI